MRPIRSVSVLMPTWQGIGLLERSLDALARQKIDRPWDFLAIDSGSSDGTWELLGRAAERFPVALRRQRIHPIEFDHGDTRNLLAARSSGDLLVYLTQDAIPSSTDWLARLVSNFEDRRVAAACCRNVPRRDSDLLTRLFSAGDPGYAGERREARIDDRQAYGRMSPHEKRLLYNFNDVASAIRREIWELHPFPRASFGEDILMARALLEAGYTVVYDAQATVEHSHDYSPEEMRERARVDGRFNAEWLGRICVASRSDARVLEDRQLELDRAALRASGLEGARYEAELARAASLRRAAFEGLHEGGLSPVRRRPTRLLARKDLSILYVVHGFPPDTWAGTEVYTLNLAGEMQRRGHRVAILARAPAARSLAEGGPPEFSLQEGSFEGLRVWRMIHRLEHPTLRESYRQSGAEEAFREVLEREKPDLVHFMHLIHLSAGLVSVARERSLPTVVTCHDYWAICARVQLIRPDGVRCEENMGSGCFLCLKEKYVGRIPALRRAEKKGGRVLDALASRLGRRFVEYGDLRERHGFVAGAYRAADLRISPSRFLRQKLVDTAGFEPETFLYSDNGMRTDHLRAFEKKADPERRLRFGFVGSLVWYKGAEVMLRAMKQLADTRAVLHVYGDYEPGIDAYHAALQRQAGTNVSFRGRFDNAELSSVFAEIDVLLVPSVWWENSPITIHEAFLTHTPVIASGIGGMAEFVRDGVDGLLFAVGDHFDLARKMRRFLDEPDLLARLSRDPPAVKTIEEDAAASEYRYRALRCVIRAEPSGSAVAALVEPSARAESPVESEDRA